MAHRNEGGVSVLFAMLREGTGKVNKLSKKDKRDRAFPNLDSNLCKYCFP